MNSKKLFALCLSVAAAGCTDSEEPVTPPPPPPVGQEVEVAAGDLAGDTLWEAKNTYRLKGQVFVTTGTLTIEPGTKVVGDLGSALVITKDAKLEARGTANAPILFTSGSTMPAAGDWGGLVMLGKAPINVTGGSNKVEGFPESVGDKIAYGGNDPAHSCGALTYVRIEFAGFELATDNELNALTLGGCGTGTTVSYVQTHMGLDDGIEVFGGTVNMDHIVITQPDDDGLDWDFGWNGKVQFLVIQQGATYGDKAFEADNNKNNNDAEPRSAPELWNVTLIGGGAGGAQGGIHVRRGTAMKLYNAIIMGFEKFAVNVDGKASAAQALAGALTIENSYLVPVAGGQIWPGGFDTITVDNVQTSDDCVTPNTSCFDESAFFAEGTRANILGTDPALQSPTNPTAPVFVPAAPLPAGKQPPAGLDTTADFIGAVGATDWLAGWTAYPASN